MNTIYSFGNEWIACAFRTPNIFVASGHNSADQIFNDVQHILSADRLPPRASTDANP